MSTSMMEPTAGMSPRIKARIAGALYLIAGEAFSFSENSVRAKLVVLDNAATTANNIMAHESLYRRAFAVEILPFYIIVTIILYDLLKPVNKNISLLAAVMSLMGCAIGTVTSFLHIAPLVILKSFPSTSGFTAEQLQHLALFSLSLGAQVTNIMMVFFGFYCMLIGYLILRSSFLPRIIGAFLVLAGVCYQINSFANFLALPMATYSFRYIALPSGILGEGSLILWLLLMGVNSKRWYEQAGAIA